MSAAPLVELSNDPALPHRDLLLDVTQAARMLSARIGVSGPVEIQRCERARVKYLPGASLRVLYRVEAGGRSYTIATRAFTDGRSQSAFERAASQAVPTGALSPVGHDAELGLVYWTFPNDRKINGLAALASPPERLATIGQRRWRASRVVAYAPEKCVTAECLSDTGAVVAYAKVYAADERATPPIYEALWKSIRAANSNLRIPRVLAYCEENHTMLLEPLAGCRAADLREADRPQGFHRLGAALAALHRLPVPDGMPPFTRLRSDRLRKAAQIISAARPEVAKRAAELVAELCARRLDLSESAVCLHGDVHPKNGILHNDRMALIDLDQAGTGAAAADLGSLLAALRYSRLTGLMSPVEERDLTRAFLRGYSDAGRLPQADSLRWHIAAALLAERALRAVNRVRTEGLQRLSELLLDSQRVLTESGYDY